MPIILLVLYRVVGGIVSHRAIQWQMMSLYCSFFAVQSKVTERRGVLVQGWRAGEVSDAPIG